MHFDDDGNVLKKFNQILGVLMHAYVYTLYTHYLLQDYLILDQLKLKNDFMCI